MLGHALARLPAFAAEARSMSDAWTFHVIPHALARPTPTAMHAAAAELPPIEPMATGSSNQSEDMTEAEPVEEDQGGEAPQDALE